MEAGGRAWSWLQLLVVATIAFVLPQATQCQSQPLQLVPLSYQTQDYEYFATLGIGTPAKPFRLVVDTGSANLWVPASQCSSPACTQRAQYNPQASSTAKPLGGEVPITYGGATITSTLVQDVVSLPASGSDAGGGGGSSAGGGGSGGGGFSPGPSFQQTIGMALSLQLRNVSSNTKQPWDGIMGMGRPALAAGDVQVPVLNMYEQGLISSPVFGLWLLRNPKAPGGAGELALGGANKDKVQGEILWSPVLTPQLEVQQGYWSVGLTGVGLQWPNGTSSSPAGACTGLLTNDGTPGGGGTQASCLGILDSGTSQIIGSIDQVAALNAALGGTPSVKTLPFDCARTVSTVLSATAQALSSPTPSAAANQVCGRLYGPSAAGSAQAILCSAVQLQLFLAQQQQSDATNPSVLLEMAQQQSMAVCEQLPYVLNVTLPCDAIKSMPDVTFMLGGTKFAVPVQDYAYQSRRDLKCYSAISAIGALGPGSWVLGDAFMHNVYTVFDYGSGRGSGPRVGIGQLTAAERAAAAELFDKALGSKGVGSGAGGLRCCRGVVLQLAVLLVALCLAACL